MAAVYKNGSVYAYKSLRRNGRVTSEYLGSGEIAILAVQLDAFDREERLEERRQEREDKRELDELDRELDSLCLEVRTHAEELLTACGFHQHHRGEWRRRRAERHR